MNVRKIALAVAAPLGAVMFSLLVAVAVLRGTNNPPGLALSSMWHYGTELDSVIAIINGAVPLYLAGLAVATGFQMNLFNIGVEGQYRIAVLLAAVVGATFRLPAPLHIALIIAVAVVIGGACAASVAVLKVKRGINEVISSIMLNYILTNIVAYLLLTHFKRESSPNNIVTKSIPRSGWFPSIDWLVRLFGKDVPPGAHLRGFVIVAIVVGIAYWILVWRTGFGFDLRASGINPFAARASGVIPDRMVVRTMIFSGAVAGMIGLGDLLGYYHRYTTDFPTGLGLTGIAVALLGRNNPAGIAVGALLWSFLDRSAQILDLNDIPKEIVQIMQGIIVLSVVIAYELTRRVGERTEIASAARAVSTVPPNQRIGSPTINAGANP
jgi:general nucleoside transport system permease protein